MGAETGSSQPDLPVEKWMLGRRARPIAGRSKSAAALDGDALSVIANQISLGHCL
jgi:hypothetical protein